MYFVVDNRQRSTQTRFSIRESGPQGGRHEKLVFTIGRSNSAFHGRPWSLLLVSLIEHASSSTLLRRTKCRSWENAFSWFFERNGRARGDPGRYWTWVGLQQGRIVGNGSHALSDHVVACGSHASGETSNFPFPNNDAWWSFYSKDLDLGEPHPSHRIGRVFCRARRPVGKCIAREARQRQESTTNHIRALP